MEGKQQIVLTVLFCKKYVCFVFIKSKYCHLKLGNVNTSVAYFGAAVQLREHICFRNKFQARPKACFKVRFVEESIDEKVELKQQW